MHRQAETERLRTARLTAASQRQQALTQLQHQLRTLSPDKRDKHPTGKSAPPQQRSPKHTSVVVPHGVPGGQPGPEMPPIMRITLDIAFSECGEAASSTRQAFESDLVLDLASACGLPANTFHVKSLSRGSVVAIVQVMPDLPHVARSVIALLERQAFDASSRLHAGRLTR